MSQRPTTFGQLLCRLISPRAAAFQHHGPVIASATEVAPTTAVSESPQWVILHSITDSEVQLIHPRPVAASELAVQIRGAGGEILSVVLAMADSQKTGELYESKALFLHY